MKLNCIVVDDEPLAVKVIESYINKIDGLILIAKCSNAIEAFNQINSTAIDVIFLDIKMPKITGIELIKSLKTIPKIILTTAYREFAVESYELNVVDYLLKPISFERFMKAIGKLTERQVGLKAGTEKEHADEYIFVKSNKKQVKILLKEILYIEGLKEYLQIITKNEKVISYLSLAYMEEKLPEDRFIRTHRSYIINTENISSFSKSEINIGKKSIPIGRHYKQKTLKILETSLIIMD